MHTHKHRERKLKTNVSYKCRCKIKYSKPNPARESEYYIIRKEGLFQQCNLISGNLGIQYSSSQVAEENIYERQKLIFLLVFKYSCLYFPTSPLPAPPIPTSHPRAYSLQLCPYVPYTCSLMTLPLFSPLSFFPLPSGYRQSIFFFKIYSFIDREEGRDKEGEKHQCVVASRAPYWGPGLQPRHVP